MKKSTRLVTFVLAACIVMNCIMFTSCGKSDDNTRQLHETNMKGIEYYQTKAENIAIDKDTGVQFVNNEILVYAKRIT